MHEYVTEQFYTFVLILCIWCLHKSTFDIPYVLACCHSTETEAPTSHPVAEHWPSCCLQPACVQTCIVAESMVFVH